jgi:hypothetical protein
MKLLTTALLILILQACSVTITKTVIAIDGAKNTNIETLQEQTAEQKTDATTSASTKLGGLQ